MKDSYIRSLVEQNVLMRAKTFAGSFYSTWSQTISQWWDHNPHKDRSENQWLEDILKSFGKPMETHDNDDEYVHVNYTETGLLRDFLKSPKASCDGTLKTFSEFNEKGKMSTWRVCLNGPKLTVLSSRMGTGKEKMKMEMGIAKEGHEVTYLNHDLTDEMADELAESNIAAFQLKLGKGDYEKTVTLSNFMKQHGMSHIDVLIMDLNQREWQVIDNIIEDGLLSKVGQITLRGEFKPIWEADVLNWDKELNARALNHLEVFMEMERVGMKILYAEKDAAANDESQWLITWLNTASAPDSHSLLT